MANPGWTLDELVRRACDALAAQDVRAPNGRVTPQPDRRVVRWYATIGLVDRPVAYHGRTARYGPRHLLQVVAVKRRQAQGRSLAEIQAELTGATDATLREVAQIPPTLLDTAEPDGPPRSRFWAEPAPAPAPPSADDSSVGLLYAVVLHEGATLVLRRPPDPEDLAALRAAADPLLDLLAQRDLLAEPTGAEPTAAEPTGRT